MCTASIQGKELALHVEEADICAVTEGGVHETATLRGEPRDWAYEPPGSAFRVPLLIPGARRHVHPLTCASTSFPSDAAASDFCFSLRGSVPWASGTYCGAQAARRVCVRAAAAWQSALRGEMTTVALRQLSCSFPAVLL